MRLSMILLALLATTGSPAPLLWAQEADLFFDTVDVNVVNLEVVVTDREGQPVTGLGPEDFRLFEDEEKVELTNFYAVEGGVTVKGGLAGEEPAGPVADLPTPETQRLQLVIFVDNLSIRPENRNPIFGKLRQFVEERLDPEDRVMITTAGDRVEIAQPFTNDPLLLLATIARLENQVGRQVELDVEYRTLLRSIQNASLAVAGQGGGLAPDSGFGFESAISEARSLAQQIAVVAERRYRWVLAATDALDRFIGSLAGMRGRKAVLYVSDGLPVRAADALVEAWMGKYGDWITQTGQQGLMQQLTALNSLEYDASSELRRLVSEAGAKQVAFYPISSYGRGPVGPVSAEFSGSGSYSGTGSTSRQVDSLETFNREASLLRLAAGTGGVAYTRSRDIGGLLQTVKEDFSTFYSLGFQQPPESEENIEDQFHRLEVRVEGKGLKVRYRRSFAVQDPLERLEDLTLAALHHGVESNSLGARLDPGEAVRIAKKRYRVPVMIAIPFQNLLMLPQEDAHVAQVTVLVAARDERGGVSPVQEIALPIRIANDQIAEALQGAAGYPLELELRSGPQRITVGIWDHLARASSTLNLELDVGAGDGPSSAQRVPEP